MEFKMTNDENGRWLRMCCWMMLFLGMVFMVSEKTTSYQKAKGEAISRFLLTHNKITISAEDARFINIGATFDTFDIVIKNCNIFPK